MWTSPTGPVFFATALMIGCVIEWSPPTRERQHACIDDLRKMPLDILVAEFKPVAAGKRHVADVCNLEIEDRRAVEHVVVGADAVDGAQRAGSEARPGAVGNSEVHRHADDRDLQVTEIRVLRIDRAVRRAEEGRHSCIGSSTGTVREDLFPDPGKFRIEDFARPIAVIFRPQALQFRFIPRHVLHSLPCMASCPVAPGHQISARCRPAYKAALFSSASIVSIIRTKGIENQLTM